jgi:hypothetical protein
MNKKPLTILSLILVIVWATLFTLAQTKTNSPSKSQGSVHPVQTENVLTVNGTKISGRILVTNNVKYIAIDDLANGLNGSVTYSGKEIWVNLPILQKVAKSENRINPPSESRINSLSIPLGKVKGIITYYNFNRDDGNKPDVGGTICLVEGLIDDIPEQASIRNNNANLAVGNSSSGWKEYKLITQTTADDSGSYEIENVPPGKYTLVFKSSHAKGVKLRDSGGKVEIKHIIVESGKTVDGAFDFGMTAY